MLHCAFQLTTLNVLSNLPMKDYNDKQDGDAKRGRCGFQ